MDRIQTTACQSRHQGVPAAVCQHSIFHHSVQSRCSSRQSAHNAGSSGGNVPLVLLPAEAAADYPKFIDKQMRPRSFKVCGPTIWNDLPARMKDPSLSFDSFRKLLKTFLFDKWLLHERINLRREMFIIIIIIIWFIFKTRQDQLAQNHHMMCRDTQNLEYLYIYSAILKLCLLLIKLWQWCCITRIFEGPVLCIRE